MRRKPLKMSSSKKIFKKTSAPHPMNNVKTTVKRGGTRLTGN